VQNLVNDVPESLRVNRLPPKWLEFFMGRPAFLHMTQVYRFHYFLYTDNRRQSARDRVLDRVICDLMAGAYGIMLGINRWHVQLFFVVARLRRRKAWRVDHREMICSDPGEPH
jgi:hypothetical protein